MRTRRLRTWLPILPLALVLELGLVGWSGVMVKQPALDFVLYYWRARYSLQYGWAHVYSGAREPLVWAHLPVQGHVVNNDPLPLLWLVTPLALLPEGVAIAIWQVLTIAALVAAVRLIAPRGRFVFWLIACFGFWPVTWSLILGQVVPLVCLALAGTYVLLRRGRQTAAGLVLAGALALKPQLAFLLPFALLIAGYRRAFLVSAAGSILVLAACFALVGTGGVHDYLENLGAGVRTPGTFHIDQNTLLAGWVGGGVAGRAAEGAAALLALWSAWRWRSSGPDGVVAAGTLGSVLASPFLHTQDLAVLFVALGAFVIARQGRSRALNWFAYASLFTPLLPPLQIVAELIWLGVLAFWRPERAAVTRADAPLPAAAARTADVPA